MLYLFLESILWDLMKYGNIDEKIDIIDTVFIFMEINFLLTLTHGDQYIMLGNILI